MKSFKKFSKIIMELYEEMVEEFDFEIIDGTDDVHEKQKLHA
ncbi:MAG: hypothetical protein U5N86_07985 [Planctomycetota bacterium]|nr:hypothetical protein [Planctomycetota bacterium]